jgi:hypothetical protein
VRDPEEIDFASTLKSLRNDRLMMIEAMSTIHGIVGIWRDGGHCIGGIAMTRR